MKTTKRFSKCVQFVLLFIFFAVTALAQSVSQSNLNSVLLSNDSEISGTVFYDENGNGIYDMEDFGLPNQTVLTADGKYVAVTNQLGDYKLNVPAGCYKIKTVLGSFQTITTTEQTVTLKTGEQDFANNIGVFCNTAISDLKINVVDVNQPQQGSTTTIKLIYNNIGAAKPNAEVSFIMDKNYIYVDAKPSPSEINGNIVKWNIAPKAFEQNQMEINLKLSPTVALGTVLSSIAKITGDKSDPYSSKNGDTLVQYLASKSLPNFKSVDPSGVVKTFNTVPSNVSLVYTIHFQNTTSMTTKDLVIIDTLNSKLMPGTFMLVGASHPCAVQFSGTALIFEFLNINLPDSSADYNGSFGWVQFIINTGNNMYLNDSIKNAADIYFDYANPLRTAEARIDFINVSAIDEYDRNKAVLLFPNPFDNHFNLKLDKPCFNCNFELTKVTGKILYNQTLGTETNYSFERNNIAPGFYLYKIIQQNSVVQTGKLIAR